MSQTNAVVLDQSCEDKALIFTSFDNSAAETSTVIVLRAARIIAVWLCSATAQVSAITFSGLTVTITHTAGADGVFCALVDPLR